MKSANPRDEDMQRKHNDFSLIYLQQFSANEIFTIIMSNFWQKQFLETFDSKYNFFYKYFENSFISDFSNNYSKNINHLMKFHDFS